MSVQRLTFTKYNKPGVEMSEVLRKKRGPVEMC